MLDSYRYTYLLMGVLFFVIWLILFFYRKDNRKAMIVFSLVISVSGPISNFLYMKDWWSPISFFGPPVGILESLLVAFSGAGIMCVIYEDIFKKRIRLRKQRNIRLDNKKMAFLMGSVFTLMYVLYYLFELNSFLSINLALAYAILMILVSRKDLIPEAIVSAFLMLVVAIVVYTGLEFLTPGWIDAFWHWKNVPKIIILNVPIDDVINYLLIGGCMGVLYEYWQEGRFVPLTKGSPS